MPEIAVPTIPMHYADLCTIAASLTFRLANAVSVIYCLALLIAMHIASEVSSSRLNV
jgi:hypothetical protein